MGPQGLGEQRGIPPVSAPFGGVRGGVGSTPKHLGLPRGFRGVQEIGGLTRGALKAPLSEFPTQLHPWERYWGSLHDPPREKGASVQVKIWGGADAPTMGRGDREFGFGGAPRTPPPGVGGFSAITGGPIKSGVPGRAAGEWILGGPGGVCALTPPPGWAQGGPDGVGEGADTSSAPPPSKNPPHTPPSLISCQLGLGFTSLRAGEVAGVEKLPTPPRKWGGVPGATPRAALG